MAGRKQLPDIMGEALGWLENESPIIKAGGGLVEAEALPRTEQAPSAKVLAMRLPAAEPDPKLVAKLDELRLSGMSKALKELSDAPRSQVMSFEELLLELLHAEEAERENRKLLNRLSRARLPFAQARFEDIDFSQAGSPSRRQVAELCDCAWIHEGRDLVIQGGAGRGKTLLACVLARRACQTGFNALYRRLGSMMRELAEARKDERRFARLRRAYAKADLLVLDDWGVERLPSWQSLDLFELLEERHGQRSTLVSSRLSQEKWINILDETPLPGTIMADLLTKAVERLAGGAISLKFNNNQRSDQAGA
jgi:DNA replication protein DnaC